MSDPDTPPSDLANAGADKPTIGFIGVGHMGGPMAALLLDAGFRVLVYDRREDAVKRMVAKGAIAAKSPHAMADEAEIILGCLSSAEATVEVLFGAQGATKGRKFRLYVETATIGTKAIRGIAERLAAGGFEIVDAPVSGGPLGAQARTLIMVVSGRPVLVDRIRDIVAAIAGKVFHVGEDVGMSQLYKIVNNAIGITGAVIAYEAVVMGVKAGLDAATVIDVVNSGTGRNSATINRFPRSILPRSFDKFAPLGMAAKDIQLYVDEAQEAKSPVPLGSMVAQLWRMALNDPSVNGDGSSMIKMFERWSDVIVKGRDQDEGKTRG